MPSGSWGVGGKLPLKPLIEGRAFQKGALLDMAQKMELNGRIVWEVQPNPVSVSFPATPMKLVKRSLLCLSWLEQIT